MKKKIFIFLSTALIAWAAQAQEQPANLIKPANHKKSVHHPGEYSQQGPAAAQSSFWINYGQIQDSLKGGVSFLWDDYLFPDTTVFINYGTTWARPDIYCVNDVLDIHDPDFQNYPGFSIFNRWSVFSVDSLSIEYAYERHSAANVVDTLMVYLFNNSNPGNFRTIYFNASWVMTDYSVDTLFVKTPHYSHATNAPIATGMQTFKIPLRANDTANTFLRFKEFSTNHFNVPAGDLVGTAYSFKPGYVYHMGDTLIKKGENTFSFASYEENGKNTFPSYKKRSWNSSGIITKSVRYNNNTQGWDSLFVPAYDFTAPYGLERHRIFYKITSLNTGIEEFTESTNGVKLYQNYPNPFNQLSEIAYENSIPASIRLEFYDIGGRKVYETYDGNQGAGVHTMMLDGNKFGKGIYFYSLFVNGQKAATRKMIISE